MNREGRQVKAQCERAGRNDRTDPLMLRKISSEKEEDIENKQAGITVPIQWSGGGVTTS